MTIFLSGCVLGAFAADQRGPEARYRQYLPSPSNAMFEYEQQQWNAKVIRIYRSQPSRPELKKFLTAQISLAGAETDVHVAAALMIPDLPDDPELLKAVLKHLSPHRDSKVIRIRLIDDPRFREAAIRLVDSPAQGIVNSAVREQLEKTDAPARLQKALVQLKDRPGLAIAHALRSGEPPLIEQAFRYLDFNSRINKELLQEPTLFEALRKLMEQSDLTHRTRSAQALLELTSYNLNEVDIRRINSILIANLGRAEEPLLNSADVILQVLRSSDFSPELLNALAKSLDNPNHKTIFSFLWRVETQNKALLEAAFRTLEGTKDTHIENDLRLFLKKNALTNAHKTRLEWLTRTRPDPAPRNKPQGIAETEFKIDLENNPAVKPQMSLVTKDELDGYGRAAPRAAARLKEFQTDRNALAVSILNEGLLEEKRYVLALLQREESFRLKKEVVGSPRIPQALLDQNIRPLLKSPDLTTRMLAATILLDGKRISTAEKPLIAKIMYEALNPSQAVGDALRLRILAKVPSEYYKSDFAQVALLKGSPGWKSEVELHLILPKLAKSGAIPSNGLRAELFKLLLSPDEYLTLSKQNEIMTLLIRGASPEDLRRLLNVADGRPRLLRHLVREFAGVVAQDAGIRTSLHELCLKHGSGKCFSEAAYFHGLLGASAGERVPGAYIREVEEAIEATDKVSPFYFNEVQAQVSSVLNLGEELGLPLSEPGQRRMVKALLENGALVPKTWEGEAIARAIRRFGVKQVAALAPLQTANAAKSFFLYGRTEIPESLRKPYWDLFREAAELSRDPAQVMEQLFADSKAPAHPRLPAHGQSWIKTQAALDLLKRGQIPKTAEAYLRRLRSLPPGELRTHLGGDPELISRVEEADFSTIGSRPSLSKPGCRPRLSELFRTGGS